MQANAKLEPKNKPWLGLSYKLLQRELKRGELTIIALAIMLAVMTVFTLTSVTSRIQGAILDKSAEFIAADRLVRSSRPLNPEYHQLAKANDLNTVDALFFSTMVVHQEEMSLSNVKAVSEGYPLRGDIQIAANLNDTAYVAKAIPEVGHVWLAKRLFYALKVKVGDEVQIGFAKLKVAGMIIQEPDAPMSVFSTSPRIMMNYQDIEKTKVVQPGSRLTYQMYLAGKEKDITNFSNEIKPKLSENESLISVKDRTNVLSGALKRSERYLLLAGLLGIVLAATALAVAANRYCQRHYDPVAIFKTLGAGKQQIRRIYFAHLLGLTSVSVFFGLLIGLAAQAGALKAMSEYLPAVLPSIGLRPYLLSIATGVLCSVMFSLFPIIKLLEIPPLRVLRRDSGDDIGLSAWHAVLSMLTIFILMWGFSQQLKLTLILFFGGVLIVGILLGMSYLLINTGRAIGMKTSNPFSLAMASIKRRAKANSVQMISFTIAIQLLLTLFVLKNDIINEWRMQLPEGTPNHFLVNISEQEMPMVSDFLTSNQIQTEGLYPVVRGRLVAIGDEKLNDKVTKEDDDKSKQGQRLGVGRELNLTWRTEVPDNNKILTGKWHGDSVQAEVSVEEEIAKSLKINLGDELTFLIGATEAKVTVTSIRSVNWNSMQPNFFMILSNNVLDSFPATYITAFYLEQENAQLIHQLLLQFPTISVIEVGKILEQVQSVIEQVSLAIQFVLFVVVIAGVLVLTAQVQASLEERRQELVILRALGARGSLIKQSVTFEFFLLGFIAGVIATFATELVLLVLQTQMFDMSATIHWQLWWIGPIVGGLFVCIVGLVLTAKLMTVKTAQLLRLIA
ncbi:ABC transporter permease [Flocculibacter collagenilyticus]|uniref:ABC transporter permease n=1 Tax=Flocculibacter collagenilyticus TaxID=2744479 RepID=UPI0018F29078|nr:FtsX-like permease family protein [Flocculibacter collagenilyticus]